MRRAGIVGLGLLLAPILFPRTVGELVRLFGNRAFLHDAAVVIVASGAGMALAAGIIVGADLHVSRLTKAEPFDWRGMS